jgi:chromosome segregation ATPase
MAACEKKRAQAEIDRERLQVKINELDEIYRQAVTEAEGHGSELEQIREKGLVAASRVDSLAERLEILSREYKRVSDWLDNIEGRREALENLTETLLQKRLELDDKIDQLSQASKILPDQISKAEEGLAQARSQIEAVRAHLQTKEEEAKLARKAREELSKKLGALERELIDANHGLDKINHDLLNNWRVVFVDPFAPPPPPEPQAPIEPEPRPELESPDTDQNFGDPDGSNDSDDSEEGTFGEPENPDEDSDPNGDDADSDYAEDQENFDGEAFGDQDGLDDQDPVGQEGQGDENAAADSDDLMGQAQSADPLGLEAGPEEPQVVIAPPESVDPLTLAELELPAMAESNILVLREKMAALGEVNLDAIQEETELQEHYDFNKSHLDDLQKAMRDLKTSIGRINQTCRERFAETFDLANKKFREIFPVLFDGGDGWLTLTDEFDPLESGVEIHVHPPGKKIMVMRSLSGGEKTLTSLCLIFALYLIKPSPFCLLDEADAPLDEANIDRFNKLLNGLSQSSQIIMVTHNKRTMQIADMLYGVTMETPGVSKLVSVNIAEAEVLTND